MENLKGKVAGTGSLHGNMTNPEVIRGKSAFIRYSANADGTGFTEEWAEGQNYIGVATGQTAPTEPDGYVWSRFIDDGKVSKVTPISDTKQVYGVDQTDDTAFLVRQNDYSKGDRVVMSTADGAILVKDTPAGNNDAVSKKYADQKMPKSGGTFTGPVTAVKNYTYANGNGKYGIHMNNSDIIGINSMYFSDTADNTGEGINFKRTNGNFDSILAFDGVLEFIRDWSHSSAQNRGSGVKIVTEDMLPTKIVTEDMLSEIKHEYIGNGAMVTLKQNSIMIVKSNSAQCLTLYDKDGNPIVENRTMFFIMTAKASGNNMACFIGHMVEPSVSTLTSFYGIKIRTANVNDYIQVVGDTMAHAFYYDKRS